MWGQRTPSPRFLEAPLAPSADAVVELEDLVRFVQHPARLGQERRPSPGRDRSASASDTAPKSGGGATGDGARAGVDNHIDAHGPQLQQGDHEAVSLFGQQVYQHDGWFFTDCDKDPARHAACQLADGLPQDVAIG